MLASSTLDRRLTSKDLRRLYVRRAKGVRSAHQQIDRAERSRSQAAALREDERCVQRKEQFAAEERARAAREAEIGAAQKEERAREDAKVQGQLARHCMHSLMKSSVEGDWKVVREWLLKGASASCREAEFGYSPLHFAASCGHDAVVELLIQHQAPLEAQSFFGHTPLAYVVLAASLVPVCPLTFVCCPFPVSMSAAVWQC